MNLFQNVQVNPSFLAENGNAKKEEREWIDIPTAVVSMI